MSKLGEVFCHACGDPLRPKTTDEIKRVIPKAVSHTEYMNMVYGNNNSDYGLDFLVKLFYNKSN